MKTIPEFNTVSRTKLALLCQNMFPVSFINGVFIYKEGDPCNNIYFVRSGQLKICMKASIPQIHDDTQ